jgi:hypothetical protein
MDRVSEALAKLALAHHALAEALSPKSTPPTRGSRAIGFLERVALPLVVGAVGGFFTYCYNDREARQGEAEVARGLIEDLTHSDPARVLSAFAALEHLEQEQLATAMCRAISTAKALQLESQTGSDGNVPAPGRTLVALLGCREGVLARWEKQQETGLEDVDVQEGKVLQEQVSQVALANIGAATEFLATDDGAPDAEPGTPPVPPVAVDLVAPALENGNGAGSTWAVVLGSDRTAEAASRTVARVRRSLELIQKESGVALADETGEETAAVFQKGRWYATVVTGLASRDDARTFGVQANRRLRQGYMLVNLSNWCPGWQRDADSVLRCP